MVWTVGSGIYLIEIHEYKVEFHDNSKKYAKCYDASYVKHVRFFLS